MELVRGQRGRILWSEESRIRALGGQSVSRGLVRGILGLRLYVSGLERLDGEVLEKSWHAWIMMKGDGLES